METNSITVRVGFNKTRKECMPTNTQAFQCPGESTPRRFIHVCKYLPWFSKLVVGCARQGRGMTNIKLFDLIRAPVEHHFQLTAHAGEVMLADTPATGAGATHGTSAASSSGGVDATSSHDTAPAACGPSLDVVDDDEDPLANIQVVALATAQAAQKKEKPKERCKGKGKETTNDKSKGNQEQIGAERTRHTGVPPTAKMYRP